MCIDQICVVRPCVPNTFKEGAWNNPCNAMGMRQAGRYIHHLGLRFHHPFRV